MDSIVPVLEGEVKVVGAEVVGTELVRADVVRAEEVGIDMVDVEEVMVEEVTDNEAAALDVAEVVNSPVIVRSVEVVDDQAVDLDESGGVREATVDPPVIAKRPV